MCHLILLLGIAASTVCWPIAETSGLTLAVDPQVAATTSGNSSTVSGPTAQTMDLSRKVNTTLAIFMSFLVAITYWILARYAHELSNDVWLPLGCLGPNLAAILSTTWPGSCTQTPAKKKSQHWLFFFPNHIPSVCNIYRIEGYNDVPNTIINQTCFVRPLPNNTRARNSQYKSSPLRVATSSPVMSTMVQISIWNSVSCWLVLAMVASTLTYNGFVDKTTNDDSVVRLMLVIVYAMANLACQYRASTLLYRNFTFVVFQTCWKLAFSTFVSVSTKFFDTSGSLVAEVPHRKMAPELQQDWVTLNLELFGHVSETTTYRLCEDPQVQSVNSVSPDNNGTLSLPTAYLSPLPKAEKGEWRRDRKETLGLFDKQRESEIKFYEKSAEAALGKTLANIAVLLGICLATGLASWTSAERGDSTAAQLGSYALLLSISTGLIAVISIHSELTNATESASTLLLLLEKTIDAVFDNEWDGFKQRFSRRDMPTIGFSEGVDSGSFPQKRCLTPGGLWRLTSLKHWLPFVVFGPALLFIPWHRGNYTKEEIDKQEATVVKLKVNGFKFTFWPGGGSPTQNWLVRRST